MIIITKKLMKFCQISTFTIYFYLPFTNKLLKEIYKSSMKIQLKIIIQCHNKRT